MLLVLVAWAIYLANAVTLAGPVAFVFYMNRFQIRPEERALLRNFGEPYREFLGRVRRWL
jgi:protein-S-isoprenylcysteine O-methyltransferase Ste14